MIFQELLNVCMYVAFYAQLRKNGVSKMERILQSFFKLNRKEEEVRELLSGSNGLNIHPLQFLLPKQSMSLFGSLCFKTPPASV